MDPGRVTGTRGPEKAPGGEVIQSQASVPWVRPLGGLASQGQPGEGAAGGRGSGRARDSPRTPPACFLGCLHRAQATTSPRRPWPSNGCWRSEQSRTSRTSDVGRSATHRSAHSAACATPSHSHGGACANVAGVDAPSPVCVWGGGVPGLASPKRREATPDCSAEASQLARMEAWGGGRPAGGGRGLVARTPPACRRREVI